MTGALDELLTESDRIAARLKTEFHRVMLSNTDVQRTALDEVYGDHGADREWIKANVSAIIGGFEAAAHKVYRVEEAKSQAYAVRETFGALLPDGAPASDLLDILARNFGALDAFCLSIAQGRKSRAGAALETCLASVFDRLGYPYSSSPVINGKPDFIFPSVDHYRRHATDCIVFTSKRTLRERWRQITTEGAKGAHFFLATLDPDVRRPDVEEMNANRVNLVVPEGIRATRYDGHPNVISFESFVLDHAEPAMARWRRNGVIPQPAAPTGAT
jgi:hypothetical protein